MSSALDIASPEHSWPRAKLDVIRSTMRPRVQGPGETTSPTDEARKVEIAATETPSAIRARALAHLRNVRSEERRANIIALRCSCRGESTGCAQTPDSPPTQDFPNFGEDGG